MERGTASVASRLYVSVPVCMHLPEVRNIINSPDFSGTRLRPCLLCVYKSPFLCYGLDEEANYVGDTGVCSRRYGDNPG